MCPEPLHFLKNGYADYICELCSLPGPDVGLSVLVCDLGHTSFHFGMCGRMFVVCLLVSVQLAALRSCTPVFGQMARLLLNRSRLLAYAAQPAMILR